MQKVVVMPALFLDLKSQRVRSLKSRKSDLMCQPSMKCCNTSRHKTPISGLKIGNVLQDFFSTLSTPMGG